MQLKNNSFKFKPNIETGIGRQNEFVNKNRKQVTTWLINSINTYLYGGIHIINIRGGDNFLGFLCKINFKKNY